MNNRFEIITEYKLRVDGETLEPCDKISIEIKDGSRLIDVIINSIECDSIVIQMFDDYLKIPMNKILYINV